MSIRIAVSVLALLAVCPAPLNAQAEPAKIDETREAAPLATDGLPGLGRVALPYSSPWLLGVAGALGYGYTESVLGMDDSHHRVFGRLSLGVQPLDFLQFSLLLDGRYDSHSGAESDDGFVGDPRLLVRGFGELGDFALGGQATVWIPGNDAPSFDFSATTLDLELLAAASLGELDVGANVGFRLDQSGNSAEDAALLSGSDRIALGVSDSDAVLLGVGAAYRFGSQQLFGEWTWDVLVGDQAPSIGGSPMRLQAGFRYFPLEDNSLQLEVAVDALLSSRPPADAASPLTPFYPRIAVQLAVAYRFPGLSRESVTLPPDESGPVEDPQVETGTVTGRALDGQGNPVARAEVTLAHPTDDWTQSTTTDSDGAYQFEDVPVGNDYRVTVRADGYREFHSTLNVGVGRSTVPAFEVSRDLPNGQIRGVVQSFRGQPIEANVRVEPFGGETVTDEEGIFEIDVPPGAYTVTVTADGYVEQSRPIIVEEQGVTILNVDLRRDGRRRSRRR